MRFLGIFMATLLIASAAGATGNQNNSDKSSSESSSVATAIAGGGSASATGGKAEQGQIQGQDQGQSQIGINDQKQGQVAVGSVSFRGSRYDAANIPVYSAAALPAGFCSAGGLSGQFKDVGFSATGSDRFCKRLELADRYFTVALNVTALHSALAAEYGDGKGKGMKVTDATFDAMTRETHAKGFEQLEKAGAELELGDNAVRRFFVRTFGSLPGLTYLAPR